MTTPINPLLMTDGYKVAHHLMYPKDTTLVYSNFTPRSVKLMPEGAKKIVVFGVQYMVKYLHQHWDLYFFKKQKQQVCGDAKEILSSYLGCDYDVSHFEALHDLGYLPICIKALDEGSVIDDKIALLTIYNTLPEFYWVTNFLETLISSLIWKPIHSASLAYAYKKMLIKYAKETDENNLGFVDFQGHDFSFRGMQHPESAISSGLGFLTSFKGTDTIPCLQSAKEYYDTKNIAFSVPASEHAVMTAYGKEDELGAFKRLMEQFPKGILSVVSDSFDLWKVLTEFLPKLKELILARDGKVVCRPDSGNPVDIICGLNTNTIYDAVENESDIPKKAFLNHPSYKGVIELLWDVFGGTTNEQGYKVLDSHIGAIYGDSITLERAEQICQRLKQKGFASTNIVLGIGSYSMGYATRDSQGVAVKATYCEVGGVGREIFKDPITDDGTKKSAKGLIRVFVNNKFEYEMEDSCTWEQEKMSELKKVYENGSFIKEDTLDEIRNRLAKKITETEK